MTRRPEVLHVRRVEITTPRSVRCPVPRVIAAYEFDHMDHMLNELRERDVTSSIFTFDAGESGNVPAEMFRIFDWVISALIPPAYWEEHGVVRPWKHPALPDTVAGARKVVTFFGGFERDRPYLSQPAPRIRRARRAWVKPAFTPAPFGAMWTPRPEALVGPPEPEMVPYSDEHRALARLLRSPIPPFDADLCALFSREATTPPPPARVPTPMPSPSERRAKRVWSASPIREALAAGSGDTADFGTDDDLLILPEDSISQPPSPPAPLVADYGSDPDDYDSEFESESESSGPDEIW